MAKKLLILGQDGKLNLSLPGGRIEVLGRPSPQANNAILLIDTSSSMVGDNIKQAKTGALNFTTNALNKNYQVGLIQFASSASWVCKPTSSETEIAQGLNSLQPQGSTNMTEAIELASHALHQKNSQRAIILITDGRADDPSSVLAIARQVKKEGIAIIAIGTDDSDREFLDKLASQSDLVMKVERRELGRCIESAAKLLR